MDPSNDPVAFDQWYEAIGDSKTGGNTLTLDDLRDRRAEIIALADKHDCTNVRLHGAVLDGPVAPDREVGFLVDFDPDAGRAIVYAALWSELVLLLGHHVDLRRNGTDDVPSRTEPL